MCLNAAQAAFAMRQELELSGRWEIEVLYGVYNLYNHQVRMPNNPLAPPTEENVSLAHAPRNPKEFHALAVQNGGTSGGAPEGRTQRANRRRR